MEEQYMNLIVNVLNLQFLEFAIQFFAFAVLMLAFKTITENVVGRLLFMLDAHICVGSPVEVYGLKGRIKETSLSTITIESHEAFVRIPFKNWRNSKYLIIKDNLDLHQDKPVDEKEGK